MDSQTLYRTISETFAYCSTLTPIPSIDFIWHGGEPCIAGIDFYEEAIRIQERECNSLQYENSIQTNGTYLNKKWIKLFKEANFKLSLSIDGPESVNDLTRITRKGESSFKKVMDNIYLIKKEGVSFGVCVVISMANKDRVDEIYDFFVSNKIPFNLIPIFNSGEATRNSDTLLMQGHEYAGPWVRLFDRWFNANSDDYIHCSDFVYKSRALILGDPLECSGMENCALSTISTDPLGDVYPCTSLSPEKEWLYGNINETNLENLMNSPNAIRARNRSQESYCVDCDWLKICNGGCMARAFKFFGDHNRKDHFCASYKVMFEHMANRLLDDPSITNEGIPIGLKQYARKYKSMDNVRTWRL